MWKVISEARYVCDAHDKTQINHEKKLWMPWMRPSIFGKTWNATTSRKKAYKKSARLQCNQAKTISMQRMRQTVRTFHIDVFDQIVFIIIVVLFKYSHADMFHWTLSRGTRCLHIRMNQMRALCANFVANVLSHVPVFDITLILYIDLWLVNQWLYKLYIKWSTGQHYLNQSQILHKIQSRKCL